MTGPLLVLSLDRTIAAAMAVRAEGGLAADHPSLAAARLVRVLAPSARLEIWTSRRESQREAIGRALEDVGIAPTLLGRARGDGDRRGPTALRRGFLVESDIRPEGVFEDDAALACFWLAQRIAVFHFLQPVAVPALREVRPRLVAASA
ncbi:MAG TPA: hypothetical protein VGS12_17710 [Caulobacteraceae bacterium]|nr:hypothetical protein [Caulobacteraceae bacterium]